MNAAATRTLAEPEWHALRRDHSARVAARVIDRLSRNTRGEKHPVYDFLFTYYGHKPSKLARWAPGAGVALAGDSAEAFLASPDYVKTSAGVTLAPEVFSAGRLASVKWIRALLAATRSRAGNFGCHGLHEWAMVYKAGDVRHALPLRMGAGELARFVESLPVRCSHFDAFRFFTPEARPLNRLSPTRESVPEMEQPGCLHTNMDLYKWAYKLAPFCPSELTGDAFEVAVFAREADMRASPYEVASLGFENIRIETPAGRAEYEKIQREIAARAAPVRDALITLCDRIVAISSESAFRPAVF